MGEIPPRRRPHRIETALLADVTMLLVLTALVATGYGAPALRDDVVMSQPDGTRFVARAWGDEWQNGVETSTGYTILRDQASGYWEYAGDDGRRALVPSGKIVGRDDPIGIARFLRPGDPGTARSMALERGSALPASARPSAGEHHLLVIVVNFTPSTSKGVSLVEFQQHFFDGGGPFGPRSVKNYWETVSGGYLRIVPARERQGDPSDGIVFVTLNHPNRYCGSVIGECHHALADEAIIAANPYVDFAAFDVDHNGQLDPNELHIVIVVRGDEGSFSAETCPVISTWGHRSNALRTTVDGTLVQFYMQEGEWHEKCPEQGHPASIGVSVHELGHDLGLPDLYNDEESMHTRPGVGKWSVMADGAWGFVAKDDPHGSSPSWPDAYSRWILGFLTPVPIDVATFGVALAPTEIADGPDAGVRVVATGPITHWTRDVTGTGEYFLLENRRRKGYDGSLPGDGLLIWHVDEAIPPGTKPNLDGGTSPPGDKRLLALEEADGRFDLGCYTQTDCDYLHDATDPWSPGQTFGPRSVPDSSFYDTTPSRVTVNVLSNSEPETVVLDVVFGQCGNRSLDDDEGCDDGNLTAGDGCGPHCTVEPCWTCTNSPSTCMPDDTASCDDHDLCTTVDVCLDGRCVGQAPLVCNDGVDCTTDACEPSSGCVFSPHESQCNHCETCDASVGCVIGPREHCSQARRQSFLALEETTDVTQRHLEWRWGRGDVSNASLGAPDTTDAYTLCFFDGNGTLVMQTTVPPGGTCGTEPCWKKIRPGVKIPRGFTYQNPEGPNGITNVTLRFGHPDHSQIAVVGDGENLPTIALPLVLPATLELQGPNGACWGSRFGTSATRLNRPDMFKARGRRHPRR